MTGLRDGRVWLRHTEDEAVFRARLAKAITEAATDFGTADQIAGNLDALVDAVVNTVVTPPVEDRAARLLDCIKEEPGLWTGQRGARALNVRYGWEVTSERAVQLMRRLVERGLLVVANPPRGATFVLPFGPGGDVEYEWSTNQGGHSDPNQLMVAPERMARSWRTEYPEFHPKLLRRAVTYGPWVEVAAEQTEVGDE